MKPVVTASQPIVRSVLLGVDLPDTVPTRHVEVRQIRMIAGHAAGAHVHNGPVVGTIVEGDVLFQVDGVAETVLRPGDPFYEPAGVRIAHFDAMATDVTFLAYFLLTADQAPEIEFET